jgi:hypothetical protein
MRREEAGVITSEGTTQGCGGGTIQFAFGAKDLFDGLKTASEAPEYQEAGPASGITPNISKTSVLLREKRGEMKSKIALTIT